MTLHTSTYVYKYIVQCELCCVCVKLCVTWNTQVYVCLYLRLYVNKVIRQETKMVKVTVTTSHNWRGADEAVFILPFMSIIQDNHFIADISVSQWQTFMVFFIYWWMCWVMCFYWTEQRVVRVLSWRIHRHPQWPLCAPTCECRICATLHTRSRVCVHTMMSAGVCVSYGAGEQWQAGAGVEGLGCCGV